MARSLTTRRGFLKAVGVGAAALAAPEGTAAPAGPARPNVLLVLTDDQGWTDTSVRMMALRPDSASGFLRTPAATQTGAIARALHWDTVQSWDRHGKDLAPRMTLNGFLT